jgi:DNA processing protein
MSLDISPEERDLLTLHLIPGLGPRLTAALLNRFGTAGSVLGATVSELIEVPHIGQKLAHDLRNAMQQVEVTSELALIDKYRVHLLILGKDGYPDWLAQIHDPPHLLYVRGDCRASDQNAVAIVGSRHATSYGRRITQKLAEGLVKAGYVVVSGLARGIDGVAHRAALSAGGRTVAVLAGGLSKIYPPEHADLAEQIETAGALVTEASMATAPMAGMFPARNRLISGLSRGVVVVEAALQSGALITARHAAEQGRSVFAVPGPVDSAASGGTLRLIRDGATLVRSVDDIVEALEGVSTSSHKVQAQEPLGMDQYQRQVWELLAEQPRHGDEIVQALQWPAAKVSTTLLSLEMKRAIRRLPGNRFERI